MAIPKPLRTSLERNLGSFFDPGSNAVSDALSSEAIVIKTSAVASAATVIRALGGRWRSGQPAELASASTDSAEIDEDINCR